MRELVPICPYLLENDSASNIFISYRGVDLYYPLHGHDFYELELVISGSGKHWINNVCVPIRRGSLYLLTLSDVHRIEADEPLRIISIHYLPKEAEQMDFAQVQEAWYMELAAEDFDLFHRLTFDALNDKGRDAPFGTQYMRSITMLLLTRLLREGEKCSPTTGSYQMQTALRYIHENYGNPGLRLKDAASVCGLSQCYFSTTFHNMVGCGFSEYLTSYRLHRVCLLLANVTISITEAAFETGFSSLSHFFRVFRQMYGCTPREYQSRAYGASEGSLPERPRWENTITPAPALL